MLLCAELYASLTQNYLLHRSWLVEWVPAIVGILFTIVVLSETWPYGPQQLLFLVGIGAETLLKI